MTEKERKHQYYLQHKDELIERARRWREKNPQRSKEIQAKSSAKWRSQNRDYINARSRELYRKRRANETPKEAEARRAKRRQQDAHW